MSGDLVESKVCAVQDEGPGERNMRFIRGNIPWTKEIVDDS
jgi:hypothetical protein